ncbi:LysR family transcriptional regulator [Ensifer adhaerens]|uniref:LysR substrate-binding domain-containing protein n=1 Tax=Ensifer adhaerens TaxID=106592 RepID=A0A9Q8YH32_ENSAD|nr:LysR family transcriptional regulator [Ensifer adhaerens]USJ28411.1 LysR substrate-binding domain-containing protein [Ensifer adhaerens]
MTFEQLSIFVAVAEREHLTRAASTIGLTPSAVSASIKALESFYNVELFQRVGRRIELTQAGRIFLVEAKATLLRARSAKNVLSELGGMRRGVIDIHASQTVASHWLPARLMEFHDLHRQIEINLVVANTKSVTQAVLEGAAELGFIEGTIDASALTLTTVCNDELVVVVPSYHPLVRDSRVTLSKLFNEVYWVMREDGSGTRSEFEKALRAASLDPAALKIALVLPSNEAVLSAVLAGRCATAISRSAAAPYVRNGDLVALDVALPPRNFTAIRHKERHQSVAARKLLEICGRPRPDRQNEAGSAAG